MQQGLRRRARSMSVVLTRSATMLAPCADAWHLMTCVAGSLRGKGSTPAGAPPCHFCQPPTPVPLALRLHPGTSLRQTFAVCVPAHRESVSNKHGCSKRPNLSCKGYAAAHFAAQLPVTSAYTDYLSPLECLPAGMPGSVTSSRKLASALVLPPRCLRHTTRTRRSRSVTAAASSTFLRGLRMARFASQDDTDGMAVNDGLQRWSICR